MLSHHSLTVKEGDTLSLSHTLTLSPLNPNPYFASCSDSKIRHHNKVEWEGGEFSYEQPKTPNTLHHRDNLVDRPRAMRV